MFKFIAHNSGITFFICFLCCSFTALSQTIYLTKDSLTYNFEEDWKFSAADDTAMAAMNYDDSQWQLTKSSIYYNRDNSYMFKGVIWFRLHFIVDATIVNEPLAFELYHNGASEIYLDGKLLKAFGKINKDSSIYYDPNGIPFIGIVNRIGEHVLAVRYANFDAEKNSVKENYNYAGFRMSVGNPDRVIGQKLTNSIAVTLVMISLAFIFLTLSMLHLFMFLYYRGIRSNLFFSIFMFSIGSLFFIAFINIFSHTPVFVIKMRHISICMVCLACISFAIFIHELLRKEKKFWIWFIAALCIVVLIIRFTFVSIYPEAVISLLAGTAFYGVFSIIFAIVKKVKGIRIVGTGILFFGLFFLTLITLALVMGDLSFNDSTVLGRILLITSAMAVLSIPVSMSVYQAWGFATVNKDLSKQLGEVRSLSEKMLEQELEKKKLLENRKEELEREVELRTAEVIRQKEEIERQHKELIISKKKSDDLLLNILPSEIAEELKANGESTARQYDQVTVLFTDFVNFTHITENLSPKELVREIDVFFKAFDAIIERNGLEKIKTIGDAYLAVCGMPEHDPMHAIKAIRAGLEILHYIKQRQKEGGIFEIRIGVNSGSVVAGIVGIKKFAYDIWGDTVNTAARMEQNSEPGKINISGTTYELVKDNFQCEYRGKIAAKNKGEIDMYFVSRSLGEG